MLYSVKSSSGGRKGASGGRLDPHKGMTSTQIRWNRPPIHSTWMKINRQPREGIQTQKATCLWLHLYKILEKLRLVTESSSTVAKFWRLGKEADSKRQGTRESGGWAFLYLDCHDASLCTCQNWLNHLSYKWHPNKFDHLEKVNGRPHTRL